MAARPKKSAAPSAPMAASNKTSTTGAAAATRQAEIETKLEIDPTAKLPSLTKRRKLAAVGITDAAEPKAYELDATYYDTADLHLLRSKMTLRRRTGGTDAGWHLKLPVAPGARTEVGLPLAAGEPGEVPAELAGLVRGAARGYELVPVARLVNERTVRHLLGDDGRTMIEVADDHVTATPLLRNGGNPSQWRELEAEIIYGTPEQLAATVDLLINAGATKASSASKLARALSYESAPARRSKNAGDAVLASMSRQRDRLIKADRGLREGLDEALHDAHSAASRISAMLTVYAPLFDGDSVSALSAALSAFVRTLCRARNLEVAQHRLIDQLTEEPEEYARVAQKGLENSGGRRLLAAQAEARVMLDSDEYLQMLRDVDGLLTKPSLSRRAGRAAGSELPSLITSNWRHLREQAYAGLADPDNVEALQSLRGSAETLRYATEGVIEPIGPKAAVLASALEEIQETLGEIEDARFAARLLVSLSQEDSTDGIVGFAFGRLHAFEQAMMHSAFDEFSDVWHRIGDGELVAAMRS